MIYDTNYTVSAGDVIYRHVEWDVNNLLRNRVHRAVAHYDMLFRTAELHEEGHRADLQPVLHPPFEMGVTGIEIR